MNILKAQCLICSHVFYVKSCVSKQDDERVYCPLCEGVVEVDDIQEDNNGESQGIKKTGCSGCKGCCGGAKKASCLE